MGRSRKKGKEDNQFTNRPSELQLQTGSLGGEGRGGGGRGGGGRGGGEGGGGEGGGEGGGGEDRSEDGEMTIRWHNLGQEGARQKMAEGN